MTGILLVEDDAEVRRVARLVLENEGYRVVCASNGHEAVCLVREYEDNAIALVIADLVMPRMGGKEMVEWLKAALPDLKILFMSGCPKEIIAHQDNPGHEGAFLAKPFTPTKLSLAVRELLGGENSRREGNEFTRG